MMRTDGTRDVMLPGLIVEDDADVAQLLSTVLRGRNVIADTAHTAATARALLARSTDYAIAILDLHLPDMGGLGLIESIESEHPDLAQRSLIVTGFPTVARAFSTKIPVVPKGDIELLRSAIDEVLKR